MLTDETREAIEELFARPHHEDRPRVVVYRDEDDADAVREYLEDTFGASARLFSYRNAATGPPPKAKRHGGGTFRDYRSQGEREADLALVDPRYPWARAAMEAVGVEVADLEVAG